MARQIICDKCGRRQVTGDRGPKDNYFVVSDCYGAMRDLCDLCNALYRNIRIDFWKKTEMRGL